jgi:hypothetical protein
MRCRCWLCAALVLPAVVLSAVLANDPPAPAAGKKAPALRWKKTVVDKAFRSEGVAVADVNKDGKPDIIVGDLWYKAPNWTPHVLRKHPHRKAEDPRPWDPHNYSESFAVFAGDFNGDGWPDVVVLPFPGKECYWYENPKGRPGPWKEHLVWPSACNETPLYADLFGDGKRVLIMGVQPKGKDNEGELCWFRPGKDATQPWEKHSISGPSRPGAIVPGTFRFSHGLGVGDVNGDRRPDVICTEGWWEQPAKDEGRPWRFHRADLGPACADMHTYDINGDGLNDILSSSAHNVGLWWHEQRRGRGGESVFIRHDLFQAPREAAKLPKQPKISPDEAAVFVELNKLRAAQKRAPWKLNQDLSALARLAAQDESWKSKKSSYAGAVRREIPIRGSRFKPDEVAVSIFANLAIRSGPLAAPNLEIGVGVVRDPKGNAFRCVVLLGDRKLFALFSQSHALHVVDLNGDGLKDLVTGRRYWAHGPHGDDTPADPAYLYWFEARRNKRGETTFIPHLIDDDSGIGTQFAIADINGDELLDIIISNKKGVFVFEQVRTKED